MSEPQHTPTPWVVSTGQLVTVRRVGSGDTICGVHRIGIHRGCDRKAVQATSEANAALIVRAVNAHDTLVSALKTLRPNYRNDSEHARLIDAALKAAEGR